MTRAVLVKPGLERDEGGTKHGANEIGRFHLVQQFQKLFDGEFDSGSERTLAAWIRHASRTEDDGACFSIFSGARVSNT